jgi:uncharacterized phage protein gp47/JayE
MPAYMRKNTGEILNEALKMVQTQTPITSMSPGSMARALVECITTQLGDFYDIMDYNLNQNLLSTASGSALDMFGALYNLPRKAVNEAAVIDKQLGAFYFYLDNPVLFDITIPSGTNVYANATSHTGRRHSYSTVETVIIIGGRTRAFAGLTPNFSDTVFTAGPNTLTLHDFPTTNNIVVKCTNPKEISQLVAFETDDAYRLRLMKNIRVAAGGTSEAIRFAVLGVSGVRDLRIRQAPYGMGSLEVVVVPEQNGNVRQIMDNVNVAVASVRPIGSRVYVRSPETIGVDISVNLIMPGAGITVVSETAIKRAQVGILRYLNSLLPGQSLVYNRLISIIIDSSEVVKDVIVKSLTVNGVEIMRRNYKPDDDQQLIPGNITVQVATS